RGWLDSNWYREIKAPPDFFWIFYAKKKETAAHHHLSFFFSRPPPPPSAAMIGDAGRTSTIVSLTRPRSARPFTVDDMQRLDRLRPWLAHALRPQMDDSGPGAQTAMAGAGPPART